MLIINGEVKDAGVARTRMSGGHVTDVERLQHLVLLASKSHVLRDEDLQLHQRFSFLKADKHTPVES